MPIAPMRWVPNTRQIDIELMEDVEHLMDLCCGANRGQYYAEHGACHANEMVADYVYRIRELIENVEPHETTATPLEVARALYFTVCAITPRKEIVEYFLNIISDSVSFHPKKDV